VSLTPNVIDISLSFSGRVYDMSLPSENGCLLGARDESGKLAILEISNLSSSHVRHLKNFIINGSPLFQRIQCYTQEGLSREQYMAMSFEERIAYDKKQSSLQKQAEAEAKSERSWIVNTGETRMNPDQLRTHCRSLLNSPDNFHENLFTMHVIPENAQEAYVLRQALSGLGPTEITELVRLSMTNFASAPVERVRILAWIRHLIQHSGNVAFATRDTLQDLQGEIGERMDVYKDLMRLHGRTKLLVSQLSTRKVLQEESYSSENEEVSGDSFEDYSAPSASVDNASSDVESMEEDSD
jgi:hypothetical protein